MTAVGIVLIVILSIVLLAFLLLCLKLSIRIVYNEKLMVFAGLGFFRIKLYPKKAKKDSNKGKGKKRQKFAKNTGEETPSKNRNISGRTSETVQDKKNGSDTKDNDNRDGTADEKDGQEKKKTLADTVSLIGSIIKKVGETFGKHGDIRVYKLMINVSKPQAADTAVQFGLVCAAVSTMLALCSLFGKSKIYGKSVRVTPDFISGKSSISADIKISVRPIFVLFAALDVLKNKFLNK